MESEKIKSIIISSLYSCHSVYALNLEIEIFNLRLRSIRILRLYVRSSQMIRVNLRSGIYGNRNLFR